jgi:hypothetical protein
MPDIGGPAAFTNARRRGTAVISSRYVRVFRHQSINDN